MDRDEHIEKRYNICAEIADENDMSMREVALMEIDLYKQVLYKVSDDYAGLEEAEFAEMVEKEIDSLRREQE